MQQTATKIHEYLKRQYSLDLRALAIMRIGIGLILLTDLTIRVNSIIAHYTDEGVLPVKALKTFCWNENYFSLHALSGSLAWQVFLFALAFIFAFTLVVGYKTKFSTIASWILLASLHTRINIIIQGGDDLLRILLFWCMFIPWGDRYSIDSIKRTFKDGLSKSNSYFNVAGLGLAVLIFSVYFFSALQKTSPEWQSEGSALYYALSLDQMIMPLGRQIYHHPQLLKFLTHLTFYIELIAPILFFIPFRNSFFRTIGIASIICLHIGISLNLFVGLFFLIGITSAIGLLPAPVMDKIEKRFTRLISIIKSIVGKFIRTNSSTSKLLNIKTFFRENFYYRLFINCFLLFIVAYNVLWCLSSIPSSHIIVSQNVQWIGNRLRLEQNWNMFSPCVLKEDGWYVLEGRTTDSLKIDLQKNGGIADFSKPSSLLGFADNDRWRKFGENYMFPNNDPIRINFCNYKLKKWNREHPDKKIVRLNVIFMKETTKPNYQYVLPVKEILCSCAIDTLK